MKDFINFEYVNSKIANISEDIKHATFIYNDQVYTLKSISVAPAERIAFSSSVSGTPASNGSPGLLANK